MFQGISVCVLPKLFIYSFRSTCVFIHLSTLETEVKYLPLSLDLVPESIVRKTNLEITFQTHSSSNICLYVLKQCWFKHIY